MITSAPLPVSATVVRRVALAGAGMISRHHLLAWQAVPGMEVVALADPDLDRAAARGRAFGIERVYPGLAELLAAESVDAVDVASPRETHAALVRLAAEHGAAVLCQKPLAPTLAEAERLATEVGGRIRVMVHENWRFRPAYRRLRRWIEETEPGPLLQGSVTVHGSGLIPDPAGRSPALDRQPFFRTEGRLLITEALIHQIDVLRWLVGPLRLVAARALRTSQAVVGETCATLLLETEAGAPITVQGNWTVPGTPARAEDDVWLVFRHGTVRFGDHRLSFEGRAPETVAFDPDASYQASFDAAVAHFVEALRAGTPFETEIEDNLETLRIVEDAYRLAGPIRSTS
jgi:D-apiose dehydrogenase